MNRLSIPSPLSATAQAWSVLASPPGIALDSRLVWRCLGLELRGDIPSGTHLNSPPQLSQDNQRPAFDFPLGTQTGRRFPGEGGLNVPLSNPIERRGFVTIHKAASALGAWSPQ